MPHISRSIDTVIQYKELLEYKVFFPTAQYLCTISQIITLLLLDTSVLLKIPQFLLVNSQRSSFLRNSWNRERKVDEMPHMYHSFISIKYSHLITVYM